MGQQVSHYLRGTPWENVSFEPPSNIRPRADRGGVDLSRHAAAMPDPLYTRFAPAIELSRMMQQLNGTYRPYTPGGSIGALGMGGLGGINFDPSGIGQLQIAQTFHNQAGPPGIPAPKLGGSFGAGLSGIAGLGALGSI